MKAQDLIYAIRTSLEWAASTSAEQHTFPDTAQGNKDRRLDRADYMLRFLAEHVRNHDPELADEIAAFTDVAPTPDNGDMRVAAGALAAITPPPALGRLVDLAFSPRSEARIAAEFLLSLHDGTSYLFPLAALRDADVDLYLGPGMQRDCLTVLAFAARPGVTSISTYITGGLDCMRELARRHQVTDRRVLHGVVAGARFDESEPGKRLGAIAAAYIATGRT